MLQWTPSIMIYCVQGFFCCWRHLLWWNRNIRRNIWIPRDFNDFFGY